MYATATLYLGTEDNARAFAGWAEDYARIQDGWNTVVLARLRDDVEDARDAPQIVEGLRAADLDHAVIITEFGEVSEVTRRAAAVYGVLPATGSGAGVPLVDRQIDRVHVPVAFRLGLWTPLEVTHGERAAEADTERSVYAELTPTYDPAVDLRPVADSELYSETSLLVGDETQTLAAFAWAEGRAQMTPGWMTVTACELVEQAEDMALRDVLAGHGLTHALVLTHYMSDDETDAFREAPQRLGMRHVLPVFKGELARYTGGPLQLVDHRKYPHIRQARMPAAPRRAHVWRPIGTAFGDGTPQDPRALRKQLEGMLR